MNLWERVCVGAQACCLSVLFMFDVFFLKIDNTNPEVDRRKWYVKAAKDGIYLIKFTYHLLEL